jgi:hypothetical protein
MEHRQYAGHEIEIRHLITKSILGASANAIASEVARVQLRLYRVWGETYDEVADDTPEREYGASEVLFQYGSIRNLD